MFFPKKTKYKKTFLLIKKGFECRTNKVLFGSFGIKAINSGFIKSMHIELIRRLISKHVKKFGKLWIRVYPRTSITRKPTEVRMGKGKGSHSFWAYYVRKGRILFEVKGLTRRKLMDIIFLCNRKLPIKVKLIKNYKFK